MPIPKSITRINKKGIQYIDNVDRVQYTIDELSRAALRDVAKFLRREIKENIPIRSGVLKENIATRIKKKEKQLEVGIYKRKVAIKKGKKAARHSHLVQYGTKQRTSKKTGSTRGQMPAIKFLDTTAYKNIDKIREIESKYLSAIENDNEALSLIDESEEISDD